MVVNRGGVRRTVAAPVQRVTVRAPVRRPVAVSKPVARTVAFVKPVVTIRNR